MATKILKSQRKSAFSEKVITENPENTPFAEQGSFNLIREAAEAFIQEYGDDIAEEQKKADAFIAPLVTLVNACRYDAFPSWAIASLEELKNGFILRHLKEWLSMKVL